MRQKIRFRLSIPAHLYRSYYEGGVKNVSVQAHDGRRVQFPASLLQRFLTHSGVAGVFEIEFDECNRYVSISRVE